jgi:hypothetical protein
VSRAIFVNTEYVGGFYEKKDRDIIGILLELKGGNVK